MFKLMDKNIHNFMLNVFVYLDLCLGERLEGV